MSRDIHRGVLHQAYYPEGVYTPRDVERFKNDIAFAKQVGFNFLRVHIKIEDPLVPLLRGHDGHAVNVRLSEFR